MSRVTLEVEESELMAGELSAMNLEKLVDGGFQHLWHKHAIRSPIYSQGYSDSRFLRAMFRDWLEGSQMTITTGSINFNTKDWFYPGQIPNNRNLLCCSPKQLARIPA